MGEPRVGAGPVLHTDDDPDDVLFLGMALRQCGLQRPIEVVHDGPRALERLANQGTFADRDRYPPPCALLLDLKLPRVPGIEVLRTLRRHPALARLPVIVLSSSAHPADVEAARTLGVDAFLVKPVSFEELRDMAAEILEIWGLGPGGEELGVTASRASPR